MKNPLYKAFINAGNEAGYGVTDDYNGYRQEGMSKMDITVKGGVRCSMASAYLKPAMHRENLTVITEALTKLVILEGKKAVGVEFEQDGGTLQVPFRMACSRIEANCSQASSLFRERLVIAPYLFPAISIPALIG